MQEKKAPKKKVYKPLASKALIALFDKLEKGAIDGREVRIGEDLERKKRIQQIVKEEGKKFNGRNDNSM